MWGVVADADSLTLSHLTGNVELAETQVAIQRRDQPIEGKCTPRIAPTYRWSCERHMNLQR